MTPFRLEGWMERFKKVVPIADYSNSIRCVVCNQPLGRKGDSPMVKVDSRGVYKHSACVLDACDTSRNPY